MVDQHKSDHPPNELLRAVGLHKSFHNGKQPIPVLSDLNLILQQGDTLAVVGASGIGKSTLLHLLGTLDRPDAGALFYRQENVLEYSDQRLARFRNQTMGFVFQFHHLLPEFTALENTMMPALIQGTENREAARMAESILVRVGLKDRLHHKATALSGGEQQRVALARALTLKPALLLADEPTGNLDKGNSEQIHQLLLELNTEMEMAMVVVTHNMELASYMAKQATLAEGHLQYLL